MRVTPHAVPLSLMLLMLGSAAFAQDRAPHGHAPAAVELPEACRSAEAPPPPDMAGMAAAIASAGEAQREMMQGMMATEGPMIEGMMAEDADIAFACAMIPHHQGAIIMAESSCGMATATR